MVNTDRIVFAKNPWPKGHRIAELHWSGRIEPDGLWFDLHLATAAYGADDRPGADEADEEEVDEAWRSKAVWSNYGRCRISSTFWRGSGASHEARGFRVATAKRPLDFKKLAQTPFRVDVRRTGDALGSDGPRAFDVYLLGHDSVAHHTIHFARRVAPDAYALAWDGRIALTYAGSTRLDHRFAAMASRVDFEGFAAPKGMTTRAAQTLLAGFVTHPDAWSASRRKGRVLLRPGTA